MKRFIIVFLITLNWLFINNSLHAAYMLYFTSSPSSFVGQGQTLMLTETTASFSAFRYRGAYNNSLWFDVIGDNDYTLKLIGSEETLPTVGFYPNAKRWPFMDSNPGLSFVADHRENNSLTGYFNVLQADYDINGDIVSFAVDFMQYDEGVIDDWVSGSIRYNSDIPIPEPCTLLLLTYGASLARRNRKC